MLAAEKDFIYVVNLEVFPEFDLPDYTSVKVKKYRVDLSDANVEKSLERLREQLASYDPVQRTAQRGDRLTVDYTSLLNGKVYPNNSGKEVSVDLGSGHFIKGFEEGLEGSSVGETREMDLEFPADWRMEKLAGKAVHFSVTIKSISEKKLPALDEAFAKKIGASGTDLPAIKATVRENLVKQVNLSIEEKLKKTVLDTLLGSVEIMLPKALVEQEVSALHEDMHRKMGDKAMETCHHHGLDEEAERRVALSLLLRKIVNLEKLAPDAAKVKEKIAEISQSFGNAEFIEKMYYESRELLSGIQNAVLVDQVISLILEKATILEETVTLEALLENHG